MYHTTVFTNCHHGCPGIVNLNFFKYFICCRRWKPTAPKKKNPYDTAYPTRSDIFESSFTAQSSNVSFHWNVAKETFEPQLWALSVWNSIRKCYRRWDRLYWQRQSASERACAWQSVRAHVNVHVRDRKRPWPRLGRNNTWRARERERALLEREPESCRGKTMLCREIASERVIVRRKRMPVRDRWIWFNGKKRGRDSDSGAPEQLDNWAWKKARVPRRNKCDIWQDRWPGDCQKRSNHKGEIQLWKRKNNECFCVTVYLCASEDEELVDKFSHGSDVT